MASPHNYQFLKDPYKLCAILWPHIRFYDRERDLIYSVWHNKLTICVAGNMLGKDYTAAFIALSFFLTRHPCRIVTTSVDGDQLSGVLWGEMRRLIQESKVPLNHYDGGPLIVNDLYIRKMMTYGPNKGEADGLSYLMGKVAKKGEGMLGHHISETGDGIPRTLFMGDEASGLEDETIDKAETWFDRGLLIGNAYPTTNRFWKESEPEQGGGDKDSGRTTKSYFDMSLRDINEGRPPKDVEHYLRKVIRIPCSESPNVKFAEAEIASGKQPSGRMLVPGVMSYWKYKERREMWDEVKQCIQLDAEFYKGAQLLLFPPDWLNESEALESLLPPMNQRIARAIGCDPGEGDAETAWYVIDDDGILDEIALKTPDTSVITDQSIALLKRWNVDPWMIMFDRGGGGKQIADEMRRRGYPVRTVAFGESVTPEPKRGMTSVETQLLQREERYAYFNRRAMMFGDLSDLLNPALGPQRDIGNEPDIVLEDGGVLVATKNRITKGSPRFCIPSKYRELRRQLAPFPKTFDKEGRLKLPPKNKPSENSNEKTLVDIIGCSPDRADALVVAIYCRDYAPPRPKAGSR